MQKIEKKLKTGEVLAFKTDTVWGFGVDPCDDCAIDNLYEIKKRDTKKPLILMSSDIKYLSKYIKSIPLYAQKLINKYLPGALTLIFEKSDILNPKVTSYSNTVGIRIPDSKDYFNLIDSLEKMREEKNSNTDNTQNANDTNIVDNTTIESMNNQNTIVNENVN